MDSPPQTPTESIKLLASLERSALRSGSVSSQQFAMASPVSLPTVSPIACVYTEDFSPLSERMPLLTSSRRAGVAWDQASRASPLTGAAALDSAFELRCTTSPSSQESTVAFAQSTAMRPKHSSLPVVQYARPFFGFLLIFIGTVAGGLLYPVYN
eukprot:RCo029197